jgi:Type I phosphodiesterase / nucleotide pyrophosphatase
MKTQLHTDCSNSTFGFSRLRRTATMFVSTIAGVLLAQTVPALADGDRRVDHVLLVSVDGMHQSDLAWYVRTHPESTLAVLADLGIDYSNARTPFPSDSFPGMVGQVTGGNPKTTGIYYDDTWNHEVVPAGTTNCAGPAPGGEVTYFEALDTNQGALDAGQGIVPAPGPDPWANILQMTDNPLEVIDP